MTLSAVSPRAMCCVVSSLCVKSNAAETKRAEYFYRTFSDELSSSGYLPYRTRHLGVAFSCPCSSDALLSTRATTTTRCVAKHVVHAAKL